MNKFLYKLLCCIALLNTWLNADVQLQTTTETTSNWGSGYVTELTLTNTSNETVSSWQANFALNQGQTIHCLWNGVFSQTNQNIVVNSQPDRGVLEPGKTVTIGFQTNNPTNGNSQIQGLTATGFTQTQPPTGVVLTTKATIDTVWATAYQATVTLTNNTNKATSSWEATFTLPGGYTLSQHTQNGKFTVSGQNVSVKNLPNGGVIPIGGSVAFNMVIIMPQGGKPMISNLKAVGNGSVTPPGPTPTPTPTPTGIEKGEWYITWTSWFTGPTFVLPKNANMINLFVGELTFDASGKPTMGGFGNMTLDQMDLFTAYCKAQNPPIPVKVSIGGGGGSYDRCWDRLTEQNIPAFAQGLADFCRAHGLVGVDFDYEAFASEEQEILVGMLIRQFKAIDPKFQTSLCTNAGFGPFMPWPPVVKRIFDAATPPGGNCAVDRLYIMSYYDPIENEKNWVLGWANWLKQNYNFTPNRVTVGIDDFDAHAYDPVEFANWAASQGFSTCHWAFDPANPK